MIYDRALVDVPTITELRSVLDRAPCFEERPQWRYRLGHQCEPATPNAPSRSVKSS